MTDRISRAAARLHRAFESGIPITDLPPEEAPQSSAEAFAIQDVTFGLLSRKAGAWKVGAAPGTEPTAAPIAASRLYPSGQVLAPAAHRIFGIEAEIAFRLGKDISADTGPGASPLEAADLRAAISTLIVTVEIVESRLADWPKVDPLLALMDFQANDSLVLGTEIPLPDDLDFSRQPVRLLFDGKPVFEDTGSHKGGDPFRLMAWLANHLPERGRDRRGRAGPGGAEYRLKAGDVLTTGSWNGVHFAAPGVRVRAEFPALGAAELMFR